MPSVGPRPPMPVPDVVAELLALGAATLGESGARPMAPRVRAAWPGAQLAAPGYPVRCEPGDNLAIHVAAARAPEGSALVVSVGGAQEFGYWGEVLTVAAQARGLAGIVIDGGVRDVAALEARGFAAFSTTIALRGATKSGPGSVGESVEVGDVIAGSGDWVVGDRDGVAVVPADGLARTLSAGRARADKEAKLFEQLGQGRTTIELLDIDPSSVHSAR